MERLSELMLVLLDKKDSGGQEALGRSKGGFTRKIHALVDALGNPLKFTLTAGQRNDITQAEALTENVHNSVVVADKGYDSNAFVASLESKGCEVTKKESKSAEGL